MKKIRIIALLMIVTCIAFCFTITPVSAADEFGEHFVVNGSDGFGALRSGPGTNYSVIKEIPNGDRIVSSYYDGGTGWYYVKHYNGSTNSFSVGYMHSSVFRFLEYPTYNDMCTAQIVSTAGSNLNVRSTPSTAGTLLASIPNQTVVTIAFSYNSSWAQVLYDGVVGYCSKDYLDESPQLQYTNGTYSDYLSQAYEMININYYVQNSNGSMVWNSRNSYTFTGTRGIESLKARS